MQYIKMKVVAFDESTSSLLCSFASDETKSNDPSDYPVYAYQPINMFPDINDPEIIKKRIALSGVGIVDNQVRQERFIDDPEKIQQYKSMVGSVVEYPASQLIESNNAPIIEVL